MTCAACSARIEKGLSKLAGVEKAAVNLASENAVVTYDPAQINPEAMVQKIHDLGYEVIKDKVEFAITGMTCAACAARIEKGLQKLPGVYAANVNLATERAFVDYNSGELTTAEMQAKVKQLGYEAHNIAAGGEDKEKDLREAEINKQKRRFLLSVVLSFPLLLAMISHSFGIFHGFSSFFMQPMVQLLLATPVQFIVGWPFYRGAYNALSYGSANMDVLVAL